MELLGILTEQAKQSAFLLKRIRRRSEIRRAREVVFVAECLVQLDNELKSLWRAPR
jgi:hypothetical protein